MKIVNRLFAQAIRFGALAPAQGGQTVYGVNLVRAFEARYGFMESPKTVAEFDLSKGITFLHGFFDKRIVIDKFMIYNNGLVVETKDTTDVCVEIMSDVIKWGSEEAGVIFEENLMAPELYLSHLEVQSEIDLQAHSSKFQTISAALNSYMASYKEAGRDYKYSTMSFALDPSTGGPTTFQFERRAKQPFSNNLYFSSAPLKSRDHESLLGVIESLFTS
jgi:hypothetical protein